MVTIFPRNAPAAPARGRAGFRTRLAALLPIRFGETAADPVVPLLDAASAFAAREGRRHNPAPAHGRS